MRLVVVGAGGATRDLLRRLGELWDVTVLDPDPERLALAEKVREIHPILGDGSSKVTMDRAGIADADALVVATNDDEINLAAAQIGAEAGVVRIVAVAADPERLSEYRDSDIPVFSPDSLAARRVELSLEPRRISSTEFADGKAEAIEFRIAPDAAVRGKRLRELHSQSWIVAAVLRDNRLIVPHGETKLESGDLVTVVGAAADFPAIVRVFTSGEARFPLHFGRKIAVAAESAADARTVVEEAAAMTRNSEADVLVVVHPDPSGLRDEGQATEVEEMLEALRDRSDGVEIEFRPTSGDVESALIEVARDASVGLVVTAAPPRSALRGRWLTGRAVRRYAEADAPLLLSRGTPISRGFLVPARRTDQGESAVRAAIDLARTSGATLTGVAVVPPAFVAVDTIDLARRDAAWMREEAAVQGVNVRRRVRRGNPVRVLEEMSADAGLLLVPWPTPPPTLYRPGLIGHIVRRAECSVLLVPPLD